MGIKIFICNISVPQKRTCCRLNLHLLFHLQAVVYVVCNPKSSASWFLVMSKRSMKHKQKFKQTPVQHSNPISQSCVLFTPKQICVAIIAHSSVVCARAAWLLRSHGLPWSCGYGSLNIAPVVDRPPKAVRLWLCFHECISFVLYLFSLHWSLHTHAHVQAHTGHTPEQTWTHTHKCTHSWTYTHSDVLAFSLCPFLYIVWKLLMTKLLCFYYNITTFGIFYVCSWMYITLQILWQLPVSRLMSSTCRDYKPDKVALSRNTF